MAKKRKKKHQEEEAGEAWLLPYSDLMTLLLAVFIVLFAVSKMDQGKAEELANSFRSIISSSGGGILNNVGEPIGDLTPDSPNGEDDTLTGLEKEEDEEEEGKKEEEVKEEEENKSTTEAITEQTTLENLEASLNSLFASQGVDSSISTQIDDRGLIITLDNAILFDSGSAEIKTQNENTLLQIADTIKNLENYIRIEGHTDNVPMSNSSYPSNWELSSARATNVVKLFIDKAGISPAKLIAVGYGEYRPVADNTTVEGRAQNRRIDIIILSEKYNSLETSTSK